MMRIMSQTGRRLLVLQLVLVAVMTSQVCTLPVNGWAGYVPVYEADHHREMTYDTLMSIPDLGLSDERIRQISDYSNEVDSTEPHCTNFAHRVWEYQVRFQNYGGPTCNVVLLGAENGAKFHIIEARKNYIKGNINEADRHLGYAIHYIQDALCPPHVFPFKELPFDEVDCYLNLASCALGAADAGHFWFEKYASDEYKRSAPSWGSTWRLGVKCVAPIEISSEVDLQQKIIEKANWVHRLPVTFRAEDGKDYKSENGIYTLIDIPPWDVGGWEMSDGDIHSVMKNASALVKGAVIWATQGGPDNFGYTFKNSYMPGGPTYDWIEISSTGTPVLTSSDDSWIENINIGFFFNYYGTDYSQLAISNNGLLFSGVGTWQYINQPITQTPGVHGFIAPYWDDIVTWGTADAIYYKTLGTAPNRMFIVEWHDNQHYSSSTSGITFETILYEGTNNILFQYKDIDFGTVSGAVSGDNPPYNNGGSATVGIEGPTGDIGLQYSFNEQVITPGLAIRFKFPQFAGTNLYLSKQAPASKDRGSTMTYTLHYHNFGDTAAQNVVLEDTLPAEVEFESASDGGSYDSSTRKVIWNIGSVAANGHGYETVTVRISQSVQIGTVIQNDARISTSNLEVRYDDNEAHAQTRVTGSSLPPDVGVEPNNGGTTPSIYWHNPITFSYHSCDTATGVDIRIQISDGGPDITGSMTGGPPDWTYTTTFYPRHGRATITYTVYGCDVETVTFDIYIDPAGYIYDADTGERIAGATVWLQWPDGEGGWVNVPTGENPPISQPDENPLITGTDGQYQWDVLAGSYRVHVEAPGYYPEDSIVVSIPPPVTDLHVGLTRIPGVDTIPPTIESVTLDAYTTIPDANIHVTVVATDNVGVTSITADGTDLVEAGSTWEGDITTPSTTGDYTITIRAEDVAENFAETTVDYSVVIPTGGLGVAILPKVSSVSAGSTLPLDIKIVSTENFDEVIHVYLTTEGIPASYQADLTWFSWTDTIVQIPAGGEVMLPVEEQIPAGGSGLKYFYAKAESTRWNSDAKDWGRVVVTP